MRNFLRLSAAALFALGAASVSAQVVVSQVYGGGGNTGSTYRNDFIELHNNGASAVSVNGWSVQYASATGTTWQVTALGNLTIQPGAYFLVQEAIGAGGTTNLPTPNATGTIPMSATAGKVALLNSTTALSGACPTGASIQDFVGFGTTANCFEGTGPTPAPSNTNAVLRAAAGCTDTGQNAGNFAAGAPTPRNSSTAVNACAGLSINDVTAAEGDAGTTTFTFTVSLVPAAGPAGVTFNISTADNTATDADNDYEPRTLTGQTIAAGNSSYTFDVTVNGDTTVEANQNFFVNVSNIAGATPADTQGLGTISNDDVTLTLIHDIQGSGATSPINGQTNTSIRGIVTARSGANGFFVQEEAADNDGNPATSEGIFVFRTASSPSVAVGDQVQVTGTVSEFVSSSAPYYALTLTEIAGNPAVVVKSTGNPLPAAINLNAALPPGTTYATTTFEPYEGMRVASNDLDVVAASSGFISESTTATTSTGEFFTVLGGITRPVREPGVPALELSHASNPYPGYAGPVFDGNPERLRVNSDGQPGTLPLDVDAGDALTNVIGVMDSFQGNYTLLPDPISGSYTGPAIVLGSNIRFARVPDSSEITVSGSNLLRLFDTVNDPATSDVALTATAFANRIAKAAAAICQAMNAPDIIGTVEVENLTVLQALSAAMDDIADSGCATAPHYAAYLLEGNDPGGIDAGFLVRTNEVAPGVSRVQVNSVTQAGLTTPFVAFDGTDSSSLLNDRPSLVLEATVNAANGASEDITVIANHLRSLGGVNDPPPPLGAVGSNGYPSGGARVRAKRQQQAVFLANLVQARQVANPSEHIVLVGDFNAFEFNDGYGDSMGTIIGQPAADAATVVPSDGIDLVNPDLINMTSTKPTSESYSYSFDGSAQTLDHALVNQVVNNDFVVDVDHARINADFIEEDFDEFSGNDDVIDSELTRISDHDPVVVYLSADSFKVADLAVAIAVSQPTARVGETAHFGVGVSDGGPFDSGATTLTLVLDVETANLSVTAPAGWSCAAPVQAGGSTTVICTTANVVAGTTPSFGANVLIDDALGGRTLRLDASVAGTTVDTASGNNSDYDTIQATSEANLRITFSGPSTPVRVGTTVPVYARVDNYGRNNAVAPVLNLTADAPMSAVAVTAPTGWSCLNIGMATAAFQCTPLAGKMTRTSVLFTLRITAPAAAGGGFVLVGGTVASATVDPVPGNNQGTFKLFVRAVAAVSPFVPPQN